MVIPMITDQGHSKPDLESTLSKGVTLSIVEGRHPFFIPSLFFVCHPEHSRRAAPIFFPSLLLYVTLSIVEGRHPFFFPSLFFVCHPEHSPLGRYSVTRHVSAGEGMLKMQFSPLGRYSVTRHVSAGEG